MINKYLREHFDNVSSLEVEVSDFPVVSSQLEIKLPLDNSHNLEFVPVVIICICIREVEQRLVASNFIIIPKVTPPTVGHQSVSVLLELFDFLLGGLVKEEFDHEFLSRMLVALVFQ